MWNKILMLIYAIFFARETWGCTSCMYEIFPSVYFEVSWTAEQGDWNPLTYFSYNFILFHSDFLLCDTLFLISSPSPTRKFAPLSLGCGFPSLADVLCSLGRFVVKLRYISRCLVHHLSLFLVSSKSLSFEKSRSKHKLKLSEVPRKFGNLESLKRDFLHSQTEI